jgi:uncharacterized protein
MRTSTPRSSNVAAVTGLFVAWGGTALLVGPAANVLGPPGHLVTELLGQAAFWALFVAVLAIVVLWERQSLASLWLQPFRWQSVAWGVCLAVVVVAVIIPAREWVRRSAGLSGYTAGMEHMLALPLWYRLLAVLGAGIVEETLFSGYSVTRVLRFTGSAWLAGAVSLVVFCLLHLPGWGAGPALAFLVSGVPTMAFFIWRKDLLAMIVAHLAIDSWALIITPLFSAWWLGDRFS